MRRGISLAVLVVTIIVLVILTAATIATITGENGVIDEARKSANESEKQNVKEKIELEIMALQIRASKEGKDFTSYMMSPPEILSNNDITYKLPSNENPNFEFIYEDKYSVSVDLAGNIVSEVNKIADPEDYFALSQNSLSLEVGETKRLSINSNMTLNQCVWTSTNTGIATVDQNGNVTGVAKGNAIINVSCNGNVVFCNVNVDEKEIPAPIVLTSNIVFENQYIYSERSKNVPLKVTIENGEEIENNLITWTSSNNGVATVNNNGTVTTITNGTTNITAAYGGKTATCKVTVSDAKSLSSLQLNSRFAANITRITVSAGETVPVHLQFNPWDTTEDRTVTWSSSNTSIATVDNKGIITGVAAGKTSISVRSLNRSASCTVTVTKAATATGYTLTINDTYDTSGSDRRNFTYITSDGVRHDVGKDEFGSKTIPNVTRVYTQDYIVLVEGGSNVRVEETTYALQGNATLNRKFVAK